MEQMGVDQLRALKEQADLEVSLLQDSLNNIRTATTRLEIASNALHDLSQRPQGKKMLVPLTPSLYVPGTLDDADKVLIDVGTGYFIEKTMVEGKDYCQRKINLLKSNYEHLVEVASKKKTIADEAGVILQAKLKHLAPIRYLTGFKQGSSITLDRAGSQTLLTGLEFRVVLLERVITSQNFGVGLVATSPSREWRISLISEDLGEREEARPLRRIFRFEEERKRLKNEG
ncbi:hypothetical protein Nepgr_008905 [Nepenthes gracilis]|uniref:Prefoldin subunit 5 n=1 Tax=Nepenthes gracilis TaxID=150966 RepID=A0AAD3XJU7_NEPGR|nr:hypothetical protein Nepgr_008905 [Nepenthes gracilis]